jgi:hypothetical protein
MIIMMIIIPIIIHETLFWDRSEGLLFFKQYDLLDDIIYIYIIMYTWGAGGAPRSPELPNTASADACRLSPGRALHRWVCVFLQPNAHVPHI